MTQSVYIQPDDYAAFGLDAASGPVIAQATEIINSYLRRPEGLIWQSDATGQPAYMPGAEPILSLAAQSAFGPGTNITLQVSGGLSVALIGEAIMIDQRIPSVSEMCAVRDVNLASQSVTLSRVQFQHAANASLDIGMAISETCALPAGRSVARISRTPIVRVLAGAGRYGAGRRTDGLGGAMMGGGLLGILSAMGGAQGWSALDADQVDVSYHTGELWIPSGIMLANYAEVKLGYIAGWTYANLPGGIQQAAANIVRALSDMPVTAAAHLVSIGGTKIQRYSNSVLDADTQRLLAPYCARGL